MNLTSIAEESRFTDVYLTRTHDAIQCLSCHRDHKKRRQTNAAVFVDLDCAGLFAQLRSSSARRNVYTRSVTVVDITEKLDACLAATTIGIPLPVSAQFGVIGVS